jgi:hypothetical protein
MNIEDFLISILLLGYFRQAEAAHVSRKQVGMHHLLCHSLSAGRKPSLQEITARLAPFPCASFSMLYHQAAAFANSAGPVVAGYRKIAEAECHVEQSLAIHGSHLAEGA